MSEPFVTTGPTLTPVAHSNKAVAVGAVSFYVDRFVTGRISKFTYGVACNVAYRFFYLEHIRREYKSFLNSAGYRRIPDYFEIMLAQVCPSLAPIDVPRPSHCNTGYQSSGGPGSPAQLRVCN